ncbi:methionyl-tRNA formyltransferase, partial [Candidatus Gastranaerophilus sp. (ex Termes propinquus)]
MDENFDTGPVLMQEAVSVAPSMGYSELRAKCCKTAKAMVGELLDSLDEGMIIPVEQNEALASYEGHPRV